MTLYRADGPPSSRSKAYDDLIDHLLNQGLTNPDFTAFITTYTYDELLQVWEVLKYAAIDTGYEVQDNHLVFNEQTGSRIGVLMAGAVGQLGGQAVFKATKSKSWWKLD